MFELNNVIDGVTAIATCIGVGIAGIGLKTWKQQILGNKKYEVSIETLIKLKIFINTVGRFRAPFIPVSEAIDSYKTKKGESLDLMDNKELKLANNYAMESRWLKVIGAYADFESSFIKLEVIFNEERFKESIGLEKITNILYRLTDAWRQHDYYQTELDRTTSPDKRNELDQKIEKVEGILYSHIGTEIGEELETYYSNVAREFKDHIK
ncbi:hypothetical protein CH352_00885 [Leptospira hartskeerlii]|uniref:DUF4760 domain-containing protein n=1 Tax=Leptospira hartskeerlii TaxID=2023177 RepID=A0A2M9X8N0_9LEPT|nr:hypothetical protein [Leptospira hartskeerlii]PJZ23959.1 hypothetical protein CH357_18465 [Leptospira hartskeerlii]PJZ35223.1 hypothetical protein CH352_00885 [Leptospira hartskeerlii]